eukprot:11368900-Karenia_brevis.AAC.1
MRHFRRIEKYSGDPSQLRMWIFNLKVALGLGRLIYNSLAKEVSQVLMREDVSSDWDPKDDPLADR